MISYKIKDERLLSLTQIDVVKNQIGLDNLSDDDLSDYLYSVCYYDKQKFARLVL